MPGAVRWVDFEHEAPELAGAGRSLLYRFGPGLGYLATLRRDGAPRVHPVCPVVANGGLYVFIGNHSPKRRDLVDDGRFALHTFPLPEVDDEFYVAGTAALAEEPSGRATVYEA